jgi:hypothetical protein
MSRKPIVGLIACGLMSASAASHAFKLISDKEAALPDPPTALVVRGITRGPGIRMTAPDPDAAVTAPFNLKVIFQPRGGSKIDTSSVRVTYLKAQPIDLSGRVKSGLSEGGIDVKNAEAPSGSHAIQISVADSEGRKTSAVFTLKVAK